MAFASASSGIERALTLAGTSARSTRPSTCSIKISTRSPPGLVVSTVARRAILPWLNRLLGTMTSKTLGLFFSSLSSSGTISCAMIWSPRSERSSLPLMRTNASDSCAPVSGSTSPYRYPSASL